MTVPLFSVIMATYNRAHCIGDAIASCFKEGFQNVEVVVVDDASTDGTEALIRRLADPRIVYTRLSVNSGVNRARNVAAKLARGRWLIILDSDDLLTEQAMSMFYGFVSDPKYGQLVFTACIDLDQNITSNSPKFDGFLSYRDYVSGKIKGEYQSIVDRDLFLRHGFREDLRGGEGISWALMVKDLHQAYFSNKITRVYNNKSTDRLSVRSKNFGRLAMVFRKSLEVLWLDYLKYNPIGLVEMIAKYALYSFLCFSMGQRPVLSPEVKAQ